MNPDKATGHVMPPFQLLKFPKLPRRTRWQQTRPETNEQEWLRAWEMLSQLKTIAPHSVEAILRICECAVEQVEANNPDYT